MRIAFIFGLAFLAVCAKPPGDEGVTPPAADGPGPSPPADKPEPPPATDGPEAAASPAAVESTSTKPPDKPEASPAVDEEASPPSADEGASPAATNGGASSPSADQGTSSPPPAADEISYDEEVSLPTEVPASDRLAPPPATDQPGSTLAADGGASSVTVDEATSSPAADGAASSPAADGAASSPTVDEAASSPAADEAKPAPASNKGASLTAADKSEPAANEKGSIRRKREEKSARKSRTHTAGMTTDELKHWKVTLNHVTHGCRREVAQAFVAAGIPFPGMSRPHVFKASGVCNDEMFEAFRKYFDYGRKEDPDDDTNTVEMDNPDLTFFIELYGEVGGVARNIKNDKKGDLSDHEWKESVYNILWKVVRRVPQECRQEAALFFDVAIGESLDIGFVDEKKNFKVSEQCSKHTYDALHKFFEELRLLEDSFRSREEPVAESELLKLVSEWKDPRVASTLAGGAEVVTFSTRRPYTHHHAHSTRRPRRKHTKIPLISNTHFDINRLVTEEPIIVTPLNLGYIDSIYGKRPGGQTKPWEKEPGGVDEGVSSTTLALPAEAPLQGNQTPVPPSTVQEKEPAAPSAEKEDKNRQFEWPDLNNGGAGDDILWPHVHIG
ncbi:unnamed protein product [Acanthoscelides obtectus]|uniref:Uncharacterized protein n=1 Tax=Acanthoscelides obtectus TaxID=200917 RepID=A0A9P0MM78_ACAOB|nr:unnamed protein product [Acanthoscelides obtectus]CAK1670989.1 hypothetical protein AOBTE_LOCUS27961 [Acanthoscelides obtectus]